MFPLKCWLLLIMLVVGIVDASKIKVHLNYNNHNEEISQQNSITMTNSFTGNKVRGVGNTVSSRVSAENLKEVEQIRKPTFYSKVDRKQVPSEFIHEQRTLDENYRSSALKSPSQQKRLQRK